MIALKDSSHLSVRKEVKLLILQESLQTNAHTHARSGVGQNLVLVVLEGSLTHQLPQEAVACHLFSFTKQRLLLPRQRYQTQPPE